MIASTRFGFGCVGLTTLSSRREAIRLLHAACECGLMHFDTAPTYGRGYSEIILGEFLRETREPVLVATKFGLDCPAPLLPARLALPLHALRKKWRGSAPASPAASAAPLAHRSISRAQVETAFNRSRRVLGRERIDYYLLHEGLPSFLQPAAWEFLQTQRAAGAIGTLGVAAGGHNYHTLSPDDLRGWDVLQYEQGPAWPGNAPLPVKFPAMRHIFHSCLKNHRLFGPPPEILWSVSALNPGGLVLFSTRSPDRLRANLAA